ncbi:diketogulonate reductase-like aldo/keto reductase [Friedmanniella endophytica]|uniref:Diketogulonate reductase-like aldo/keto reductase n=1 Tax=Microlunatus kandeliicorticis TaxID=1759536 RepID=A0A7W3IPP1_9ACTN|nr:aldo/keto reductase [Microlunatus kandeliicorticis]MBA8792938.1 diketogulonate reductase-like aldo/keto reductase [Microlunatus kandeliicorticis]
MSVLTDTFPLASGHSIPKVGFGTWQIPEGSEAYDSTAEALKIGYRHIDSALAYGNEKSVGRAVRDSGIARDEIYVTTKLPAEIKDAAGAREAFETSFGNLDLGPIDLWLIHAPWPWSDMGSDHRAGNIEVWKVFEEMHAAGRVRSIGVSNFDVDDLESLASGTDVRPHVNQIRWFIGNTQPETTAYCQQHDILVEGYSPLATGKLLDDDRLTGIAEKYGKSVAQLSLRYLLEKDVLPLPKSVTPERIRANAELDFSLDADDVATLDQLSNSVD